MQDKFRLYHSTQEWFARNKELYRVDLQRAFEIIAHRCFEVMGVKRFGIWFLNAEEDAIVEKITFIRDATPSTATVLKKLHYPIYFEHISNARVLASSNTFRDPALQEFIETYLTPFNVHALLDAPIFSDGEMIGLLCIEHDTPREWDLLDQGFAGIFADVLGRTVESQKRRSYETELRSRIDYLENDLKKKLQDLNTAKVSLDLALEGAQVGKWDWDIKNNTVALNSTWFTKLGYHDNEMPQTFETFQRVLHPADVSRVMKELDDYLLGNTPMYECRYRMIAKTGEVQWCLDRGCIIQKDHQGGPTRMIGVNVNVTPLVKWEESLLISEQQLKAMIQSLPTPVAMFDRNLCYLAFSARWKEEWHQTGLIVEGRSVEKDLSEDWIKNMALALEGTKITRDEEFIHFGPGEGLWARWAIQPWKNFTGEIGGVIMMVENISSKKEAEIKLSHASKLSALGEMAGGIAHEINNPLGIIKGYVDLLRRHSGRQTLRPELLGQYINKMDHTISRISKIVNGMRRFSRESSHDEKTKYSLNKIVEETLDICLERINNNGTAVQVEYLNGDSDVFCRPIEISQVLLNLINNSFQATSSYNQPWIKINLEDLTESFRVSVIDCGKRIPQDVQNKLFQPFFTTKEIGVGTGLGLSISRGIIEEHKGKLYHQSDAPNTTFVIELPKYAVTQASKIH